MRESVNLPHKAKQKPETRTGHLPMILRIIPAITAHTVRLTRQTALVAPLVPRLDGVVAAVRVPDALAPHDVAEAEVRGVVHGPFGDGLAGGDFLLRVC